MVHKHSRERRGADLQAFSVRKAAFALIDATSHYDSFKAELICRTDREHILGFITASAGAGCVISEIPDVTHGEILEDPRGMGTFQKRWIISSGELLA